MVLVRLVYVTMNLKDIEAMKKNVVFVSAVLFAAMMFAEPASAKVKDMVKNPVDYREKGGRWNVKPVSRADFNLLCDLVDDCSFDKDKLAMVRVACIGCFFTSDQCARLLDEFSFDDGKLKALEYMVPRIVDRRDVNRILGEFSFSSNRKKAETILRKSKW